MEEMKYYIVICDAETEVIDDAGNWEHMGSQLKKKEFKFRARNDENAKKKFRRILKEVKRNTKEFFDYKDINYYYYDPIWARVRLYATDVRGYDEADSEGKVEIMHEKMRFW